MFTLEICANSYQSAVAAQEGGAQRVELCDNMAEGGTTPSYAHIALCKKHLNIKVFPIIRPRGGDFFYSDSEFELMKMDILNCKALGCDGIATGVLTAEGAIDVARTAELIQLARPMEVSFHRAFDMCNDMPKALEQIISLGCERVLTSGGANQAVNALDTIKGLVAQAGDRISIMPGAGINPDNLPLMLTTGATEFHTTAKTTLQTKMTYKNNVAKVGSAADEYAYMRTDPAIVTQLVNILKDAQS